MSWQDLRGIWCVCARRYTQNLFAFVPRSTWIPRNFAHRLFYRILFTGSKYPLLASTLWDQSRLKYRDKKWKCNDLAQIIVAPERRDSSQQGQTHWFWPHDIRPKMSMILHEYHQCFTLLRIWGSLARDLEFFFFGCLWKSMFELWFQDSLEVKISELEDHSWRWLARPMTLIFDASTHFRLIWRKRYIVIWWTEVNVQSDCKDGYRWGFGNSTSDLMEDGVREFNGKYSTSQL